MYIKLHRGKKFDTFLVNSVTFSFSSSFFIFLFFNFYFYFFYFFLFFFNPDGNYKKVAAPFTLYCVG
jgi:hypothetical protein